MSHLSPYTFTRLRNVSETDNVSAVLQVESQAEQYLEELRLVDSGLKGTLHGDSRSSPYPEQRG